MTTDNTDLTEENILDIARVEAAKAYSSACRMPEMKAARKVISKGGSRAVGQVRDIWMSGHMTASLELLEMFGRVTESGGPDRELLMILATAVVAGDRETAENISVGLVSSAEEAG